MNYISGGTITVDHAISKTAGATDTLTLQAGTNITLTANDTIAARSGHALNVLMDSDYANGVGGGYIYLNSGASITTWGGNITMGGGNGTISAGSGYAVGSASSGTQYGIYVANTLDAGRRQHRPERPGRHLCQRQQLRHRHRCDRQRPLHPNFRLRHNHPVRLRWQHGHYRFRLRHCPERRPHRLRHGGDHPERHRRRRGRQHQLRCL